MDLLADTCCMIWAGTDPSLLSPAARDILSTPDSSVFVSPASCASWPAFPGGTE